MSKSLFKTVGPNNNHTSPPRKQGIVTFSSLALRAGIVRMLSVRSRSKVVLRIPGVKIGIFEADVGADVPIRILGNQRKSGSLSRWKTVLLDSNRQIRFLIDIQPGEMI